MSKACLLYTSQKLVSLPKDRMFRSEQASKTSRKKVTDDTFLNAKGDKALSLLLSLIHIFLTGTLTLPCYDESTKRKG